MTWTVDGPKGRGLFLAGVRRGSGSTVDHAHDLVARLNRGQSAETDLAAAKAELEDLRRELADCQGGQEPAGIVLGGNCSGPPPARDGSYATVLDVERRFGARLAPVRLFDNRTVALTGAARDALGDGRPVCFSIAQSVPDTINRRLDSAIAAVAEEIAGYGVPGCSLLQRHEPENPDKGIDGPSFVAAQAVLAEVVRAAVGAAVEVGCANMAYQYDAGRRGADGSYIPASEHVDWYGVDYYTKDAQAMGTGQQRAIRLQFHPEFQGWLRHVEPRGRPLRLIEYGVMHPDRTQREQILRDDHTYLTDLGVDQVLLWLGWGDQGDWQTGLLESSPLLRELYRLGTSPCGDT